MHGLILIPYYFVGTLAALPLLMVICRLVRFRVAINTLVGGAIAITLLSIGVPLACHWVSLGAFTGRPMLGLVLLSFVFAAADQMLSGQLPLPLDDELKDL